MYDGIDAVLFRAGAAADRRHPRGPRALAARLLAGVLAFVGFALIDSFGLWDEAMSTLSLVLVAAVITMAIAVPPGSGRPATSPVSATLRPVLDVMQTMPAFVYLIPGVIFFGVGTAPGLSRPSSSRCRPACG